MDGRKSNCVKRRGPNPNNKQPIGSDLAMWTNGSFLRSRSFFYNASGVERRQKGSANAHYLPLVIQLLFKQDKTGITKTLPAQPAQHCAMTVKHKTGKQGLRRASGKQGEGVFRLSCRWWILFQICKEGVSGKEAIRKAETMKASRTEVDLY